MDSPKREDVGVIGVPVSLVGEVGEFGSFGPDDSFVRFFLRNPPRVGIRSECKVSLSVNARSCLYHPLPAEMMYTLSARAVVWPAE